MDEANASLLDKTLWHLAQRSTELIRTLYGTARARLPQRELVVPQLRSSDVGLALARIIGFAEDADADQKQMRETLEYTLRVLFTESLQDGYMLPHNLHRTPLGRVNDPVTLPPEVVFCL